MIPVVARAAKLSNAIGGWSVVLVIFLCVWLGALGLQSLGATFTQKGSAHQLFARLKGLLSDGEGIKNALGFVRYNSIRPCIQCKTVSKKGSDLAWRSHRGVVAIGSTDRCKFVPAKPTDLDQRCGT